MLEWVLLPLIHQNDQDDKIFLYCSYHKDQFSKQEKDVRTGLIAVDNGNYINTKYFSKLEKDVTAGFIALDNGNYIGTN